MRFIISICMVVFTAMPSFAAVTVTVNGSNYTIPQTNEKGWGANVTAWIQAITSNTLQPIGGTFTLTNNVDFGSSFGLLSPYYRSKGTSVSSAGVLRVANGEAIGWRNGANSGNLLLSVDASNTLTFNGNPIVASTALTASRALVSSAAGLVTTSAVTSTELALLSGRTGQLATLAGTETFTSKTLTSPIISTISNTGTLTLPTSTDTLVGKATTDVFTNKSMSGSSNTFTNIPANTALTSQVPVVNGGTGANTKAGGFDALSPMTNIGDIIYGSTAGGNARLAGNTTSTKNFLTSTGSAGVATIPAWGTIAAGDVPTLASSKIQGTATNDSASAGFIGEYVEVVRSTSANLPATNIVGGDDTISLTAGDWDVSFSAYITRNGATMTTAPDCWIGTATGDSATGRVLYSNYAAGESLTPSGGSSAWALHVPAYRVSISSTTSYYFKIRATYSAGNPQYQVRLSARRVR